MDIPKPSENAREISIGWDGASHPMLRLQDPCGCRFLMDGTLDRRCSDHLRVALRAAVEELRAAR